MAGTLVICVSTELEGSLLEAELRDAAAAGTVDVLRTGVGAVNAAIALTRYLERNGAGLVSGVVVCGIGGAYPDSGFGIGDVACAESECYGDLGAASPEGFLDMQKLGFPVVAGETPLYNEFPLQIFPSARRARFVTVNTCTGSDEAAAALVARTGGAVENMEGAAIAHVAAVYGLPAGAIRGVSNLAGRRDRASWRVKDAAVAAQQALLGWLRDQNR